MIKIFLTFFNKLNTTVRCYDLNTAKEWLENGEEFTMVGVLENGNTRGTSIVSKIFDNVVITKSGSVYMICGFDQKRTNITNITLSQFLVNNLIPVDNIEKIPHFLELGYEIVADFKTEDGNYGTTGPLVSIDIVNRTFTTLSEHTYKF